MQAIETTSPGGPRYLNRYFGEYGGRYVAEVLWPALDDLEHNFAAAMEDPAFHAEFNGLLRDYVGRPTPMVYARNLTEEIGGAQIWIKLEGLANTGAHKINNALGQALLARRVGKTRIIAETGAGQHGLATASVCAKLGFDCTVYMGELDVQRQQPNVYYMEMLGTRVVPVSGGTRTLKDAVNEALRDWSASFPDTHYLIGSALGPYPFPDIVREFQSVIGREVHAEALQRNIDIAAMVTCVGGGSNAIGFFAPFVDQPSPRLVGAEAGGTGSGSGEHAARMTGTGHAGIVQGYKSRFLMDEDGQVEATHSISAGLDYPGIGPQLAHLGDTGRIEFRSVTDSVAMEALQKFARTEGVIFALESAHGAAVALELAAELPPERSVVVNMSGRGDKDLFITAPLLRGSAWRDFLESEIRRMDAMAPVESGAYSASTESAAQSDPNQRGRAH